MASNWDRLDARIWCPSCPLPFSCMVWDCQNWGWVCHSKLHLPYRGLEGMLNRRRKLMQYYRRKDFEAYSVLLVRLGLSDRFAKQVSFREYSAARYMRLVSVGVASLNAHCKSWKPPLAWQFPLQRRTFSISLALLSAQENFTVKRFPALSFFNTTHFVNGLLHFPMAKTPAWEWRSLRKSSLSPVGSIHASASAKRGAQNEKEPQEVRGKLGEM